jgi:hypothetical protein
VTSVFAKPPRVSLRVPSEFAQHTVPTRLRTYLLTFDGGEPWWRESQFKQAAEAARRV